MIKRIFKKCWVIKEETGILYSGLFDRYKESKKMDDLDNVKKIMFKHPRKADQALNRVLWRHRKDDKTKKVRS